jgi:hypothetical protein
VAGFLQLRSACAGLMLSSFPGWEGLYLEETIFLFLGLLLFVGEKLSGQYLSLIYDE